MSRWKIHMLLAVILLPLLLNAQLNKTPDNFRHYQTDNGLSNNWVYCFLEDDLGFIWIGTRDGLNRFDGYEFKVYDESNSNLGGSYITALHLDSDKNIWVGTQNNGLYRYCWEENDFTPFINIEGDSSSISSNQVTSITESSDGRIWVGTTSGGLNSVDRNTLQVKRYDLGPQCTRITALELDGNENLWIGSWNGLFYFDKNSSELIKINHAESDNISSYYDRIYSLHRDILGRLWVGTPRAGLFYLDNESKILNRLKINLPELTESTIRKITSLPDGRIMMGTEKYGVIIIDPVSNSTFTLEHDPDNENSLINNSVYDILVDQYGSLWIGNAAGGVNYFNPYDRKFSTITYVRYKPNGLTDPNVRCFYQDSEDRIWIGTKAGVNLCLDGNKKFKKYNLVSGEDELSTNLTVLSMLEDSKGRFWVGSYSGGAKILDRKTGQISTFQHPDDLNQTIQRAHVYNIMEDNENNIWFATLGGVYILDHDNEHLIRFTTDNSNLSSNSTRVLMQDSKGIIWLGTARGLQYYNPEKQDFESFGIEEESSAQINMAYVFCLYENDNGEIWVGMEGEGIKIIKYGIPSIRTISIENGLPDNTINAIEKDNSGNFWISTNKGLCKFVEQSGDLVVFNHKDGLQADDFFAGASLFSKEGELFFGGPKGMNCFLPSSILLNPQVPHIVFTSLLLKNIETDLTSKDTPLEKPLALTDQLKLTHRQTSFTIQFVGLGFVNTEKYQYSYYLEGFDETWGPWGKLRSATYTNLDQGNYTLKVRSKNNDNQPGNSIAELKILIQPAPWASWWAYLIYLLTITGLLLLFRYYIISWTKVMNELEYEKREKNQIRNLNQMKLMFFTNISHEFRTPLTLLRGYIEKLSTQLKDKNSVYALEQIDRNSKHLLGLVEELMEFRKAESGLLKLRASSGDLVKYSFEIKEAFNELARQKNIEYTFRSQFKFMNAWFDPGKIEKVLFNLISNAFKFTPSGGSIEVEVLASHIGLPFIQKNFPGSHKAEHDWIEIKINDTGVGIPAEDLSKIFDRYFQVNDNDKTKGTGIGLAFSKRLIEIHKGRLLVSSEIGKGSSFTVMLPTGKAHLTSDEIIETDKERFYLRINYESILSENLGSETWTGSESSAYPGRPVVMIMEDDLQILNLLKDILSEKYDVIFAIDGISGLAMVRDKNPELVISDIMMPGKTGIEVCETLKCDPATSHIPVVLLTARSEESSHFDGLGSGADAYLTKPFSTKLLLATINNLLVNRQHLREKFASMDTIAPSELTRNKIDELFLNRVISYIESNLADPTLDVPNLCKELGMSRSVLYRKIKALTAHSIQEFIRGIRLRKARYLLANTDKSISEVSYLVGFPNTKHFSTSFKKEFEVSPSDFRK